MLVSMTGFGAATTRDSEYLISSEIKAVNNRFLKTSIKLPDGFASLETKIDELLRKNIDRGTVSVSIRIVRESSETDYEINLPTLRRYISEASNFKKELSDDQDCELGTIVAFMRLPGVIQDKSNSSVENLAERLWNAIEQNLKDALVPFQKMRDVEGAATQKYLAENILQLRNSISEVDRLAPEVVEYYRARLAERVAKALEGRDVAFDESAIIREVAIYADKVDISEEISRFRSHLDQFDGAMANEKACGKKLDFLTQEMFRETNTIGSKANSPDVLKLVVEMKSTIERIREMVQNVE